MFGCESPEQGQVFALALLCENMTPIEIARKYHIIQGRLTKRADAMLAEFREAGGRHRVIERTSDVAEIELIDRNGEKNRFRLTFEEVKQEKFPYQKDGRTFKDNWSTPRGRMQMLWARVVSDGIRCVAPEIVAGTYTPEEVRDLSPVASPIVAIADAFPATTTATEAKVTEAAIVDAEFETAVEMAAQQSQPQQSQPQHATQPDGLSMAERDLAGYDQPAEDVLAGATTKADFAEMSKGEGFATKEQLADLRELILLTRMPYEAQEAALKKRNCQTWRNLTEQQAGELISILRAKLPSLSSRSA
jgi:hypothetical protein